MKNTPEFDIIIITLFERLFSMLEFFYPDFYFNKLLILCNSIVFKNANLKCVTQLLMFYFLLSIRAEYEFIILEALFGDVQQEFLKFKVLV